MYEKYVGWQKLERIGLICVQKIKKTKCEFFDYFFKIYRGGGISTISIQSNKNYLFICFSLLKFFIKICCGGFSFFERFGACNIHINIFELREIDVFCFITLFECGSALRLNEKFNKKASETKKETFHSR